MEGRLKVRAGVESLPREKTGGGATPTRTEGMPTTLIVDQKGNIKKKYDGSFDKVDLEKNLKELLR
jgi:hypothetical protein